jgi:hypothetical protein
MFVGHPAEFPIEVDPFLGQGDSPIRSTARGKMWAALSGTFCIEN